MTIVYHGTSRKALDSIKSEGVTAPSYWGDLETALEYASSFGKDGVILAALVSSYDFEANVQLSEAICEDDPESELLTAQQVDKSLAMLSSVVCQETVFDFDVRNPQDTD